VHIHVYRNSSYQKFCKQRDQFLQLIGKPYNEPASVKLSDQVLSQFVGTYQINSTEERHITQKGNKLFSQRGEGPCIEIVPISESAFYFKGIPFQQASFIKNDSGLVGIMKVYGRTGHCELAKKNT